MASLIDISGERFGSLVAVESLGVRVRGLSSRWRCRCDCGREHVTTSQLLRLGKTKSCGCSRYDGVAFGADHYAWKGDAANATTKRERARRMYPELGLCEECGKQATEPGVGHGFEILRLKHHDAWHGATGVFKLWKRDRRRAWTKAQIDWVVAQWQHYTESIG